MAQLNMNVTPQFEKALSRYMRLRGFRTKSEAIRAAVREGLEAVITGGGNTHFKSWLGVGTTAPENPSPAFPDDDSLWE